MEERKKQRSGQSAAEKESARNVWKLSLLRGNVVMRSEGGRKDRGDISSHWGTAMERDELK